MPRLVDTSHPLFCLRQQDLYATWCFLVTRSDRAIRADRTQYETDLLTQVRDAPTVHALPAHHGFWPLATAMSHYLSDAFGDVPDFIAWLQRIWGKAKTPDFDGLPQMGFWEQVGFHDTVEQSQAEFFIFALAAELSLDHRRAVDRQLTRVEDVLARGGDPETEVRALRHALSQAEAGLGL